MRRYDDVQIRNRWDGKRVYKTATYPVIPMQDSDIQIVTNTEDSLDDLAYRYYRDPTLWFIIARANPGLGKGRMSVSAGLTIRIPIDVNSIIGEFNRLNAA